MLQKQSTEKQQQQQQQKNISVIVFIIILLIGAICIYTVAIYNYNIIQGGSSLCSLTPFIHLHKNEL